MENKEFKYKYLSVFVDRMIKKISEQPHAGIINELFDNLKELPKDEKLNQVERVLNILGYDTNEICLGLLLRVYISIYKDIKFKNEDHKFLIEKFFIKKDFESFIKIKQYEMEVEEKIKGSYK